jgi:oligopeptide transport system substrate-binding protein
VTDVTLVVNDAPGHREIAVAVQDQWSELGIDVEIQQQEWAQFLESLGPPPAKSTDVYRNGWVGDFVDALNFLELWTCDSGNNNTNYCNKDYDAKMAEARKTLDNEARYKIYGEAEDILFGENGEMPVLPIYFYTYTALERENIQDSYNTNLLDQVDLTKVVVTE